MTVDPVREWMDLATQDEESARFLASMRPLPLEVICFHCQQAAEKTMKAILAKNGREIPRTHDLLELFDQIAFFSPIVSALEPMLLDLNDFSVVVRYPSHVPLQEQDAVQALESIREIRKVLSALL